MYCFLLGGIVIWQEGRPLEGASIFKGSSIEKYNIKIGPKTSKGLNIDLKNPLIVDIIESKKHGSIIIIKDDSKESKTQWATINHETKEDIRQRVNSHPIIRQNFLSPQSHF